MFSRILERVLAPIIDRRIEARERMRNEESALRIKSVFESFAGVDISRPGFPGS